MENNSTLTAEQTEQNRNAKFVASLWAYALLSWLMATFPAMLVLPRLYGSGTMDETMRQNFPKMMVLLIGLCSLYGALGGLFIGLLLGLAGRKERNLPMFLAPLFGGIWGIVIGAIGGFPIFFVGGIILGWIFAVPFGIIAFTLFAVIYELLAARRRLRWWHIMAIEIGVLSVLLGGLYLLKFGSSY